MKLLLDTHALIWWFRADPLLGEAAKESIGAEENTVFVSSISAFEIATKYRIGKLPEAAGLAEELDTTPARFGFRTLDVTLAHARLAGSLPIPHKDPFDRILIAQALREGYVLVSNEKLFDSFGVSRLW